LGKLRERAEQAEARESAVCAADQAYTTLQHRFDAGTTSYLDVIDAERSLLTAKLSQIQTLNARFAATVSLIQAIGGKY
jgi:outer membrane protein TolC